MRLPREGFREFREVFRKLPPSPFETSLRWRWLRVTNPGLAEQKREIKRFPASRGTFIYQSRSHLYFSFFFLFFFFFLSSLYVKTETTSFPEFFNISFQRVVPHVPSWRNVSQETATLTSARERTTNVSESSVEDTLNRESCFNNKQEYHVITIITFPSIVGRYLTAIQNDLAGRF